MYKTVIPNSIRIKQRGGWEQFTLRLDKEVYKYFSKQAKIHKVSLNYLISQVLSIAMQSEISHKEQVA